MRAAGRTPVRPCRLEQPGRRISGSASARLFHNFCGQACGHPEHPILKPLIQRHFSPHVNEAAHGVGIPLFAQIGAASRPGFDNRAIASANAIASRPFPHFLLASLWIGWASDSQLIDPPTFSRTHQTSDTSAPCSRPCGPSTSGHFNARYRAMRSAFGESSMRDLKSSLVHNFCWQAWGHPEHRAHNTLIRRHFRRAVRTAARRRKSVRRMRMHARRAAPTRHGASARATKQPTMHFRH